MAVLAIGAIGAAVGSAIGGTFIGMSAVALGWNVGLTVGGMLFGPKGQDIYQQGPRLGDLKVQSSTYGNPLPIVYGAMRIAGNVIWSANIVETTHTTTQSSGGKGGGGGGSVTQTSYSYSQSFAVGICAGEIAGIRKIWANGKLIYNLSDTADIATIVASNKSAAGIRIYTGSETQAADSLIQASVGAADCPAYRGVAYVVFENLQLADYGNRMPNLEFEVVDNGTGAIEWHSVGYTMPAEVDVSNYYTSRMECPVNGLAWFKTTTGQTNFVQVNVLNGAIIRRVSYPAAAGYNCSDIRNMQDGSALIRWTNYGGALLSADGSFTAGTYYTGSYPAFKDSDGTIWSYAGTSIYTEFHTPQIAPAIALTFSLMSGNSPGYIYGFASTTNTIWRISIASGAAANFWTCPNTLRGVLPCYNGNVWALHDAGSVAYATLLSANGIEQDTITITGGTAIYSGASASCIDRRTGDLIGCISGGFAGVKVFRIAAASLALTVSDELTYGISPSWSSSGIIFPVGWVGGGLFLSLGDVVGVTNPTLSTIVSDICTRAGLTAGQIDVTALTDSVHGYVVQRGTARSQIEQLMSAFYFDAVESDGKIKFVKRGGSVAVSIPEDDLAAHEYGSAPPDTLVTNRRQEMELPVELHVQYMDSAAAYQIGSQYAQRLITDSENKTSLNLAIAMTAAKAKQVADVLMYDAWTSRTGFAFQTGWKYSYLEPTDVIQVTKGGRTYTVRIVDEDYALTSARMAVLEDTTVYTQSAAAAALPTPGETVSGVPLTDLMLLDIPLLRDQDDGVGYYAAACGYGDGWSGAQAFKSNDGGATWTSFGNGFLNEATIGAASSALGDFTQNIFDESSSVTVVLLNGELASDTELNVLNGANVALLGNEIIQFRNATLVSAGTYTLTGLLRGRRGTEWARASHAIGDRFVLLNESTTYLFTGSSGEYDAARKYRGVSFGGFLDDATDIDFTNTAVAQECYAPVHLGGGRNAALDVILNWVRRTRLSGGWNDYSDVPLGEASESYEVEIWDAGYSTLKRTISGLSAQTTTYTAAQQITDFGSEQATVYWKAFQLSATRGRGYEAQGAT